MKFSSLASLSGLLGSSLLIALLAAACSGADDDAVPSKDGGKDGATTIDDDDSDSGVSGSFTIGGSVSGLTAAGLILKNNGGDDKSITANGAYTFATKMLSGDGYIVTVKTQSVGLLCSVTNAAGTVGAVNVADANIT